MKPKRKCFLHLYITYVLCEFFQLRFGCCFLLAINEYRQIFFHFWRQSCYIYIPTETVCCMLSVCYLYIERMRNVSTLDRALCVVGIILTFGMWYVRLANVETVERNVSGE